MKFFLILKIMCLHMFIKKICNRTPLFLCIHMKQFAFLSLLTMVWGKKFLQILDMGHQSGRPPKISVKN